MTEIIQKTRKLFLMNFLSPGDVVMMTAAVRDLMRKYPNQFTVGVSTSAHQIWDNNPYITRLPVKIEPLNGQTEPASSREVLLPHRKVKVIKEEDDIEVHELEYNGEYPASINRSNNSAYHFIHGYAQDLGKRIGLDIPITEFKGDIHISEMERSWMSQVQEQGVQDTFWIIMGGGKRDFTAKWWDPGRYQRVVDHFKNKLVFVQCGDPSHFHPPLTDVINLIGKTDIRQYIRLVYHSDGIICGVTFAMHLAAAVPMRPFDHKGRRKSINRGCVVLAGGREPMQWEAYPHHQFISLNGALPCCMQGGCWKSRCQPVGDGDEKDEKNTCQFPTQVAEDLHIPRCMDMITAEDVIHRVEYYYKGGALKYYGDDF